MNPDHPPQGSPCKKCGHLAIKHRVHHKPEGNPCLLCGMGAMFHRFDGDGMGAATRVRDVRGKPKKKWAAGPKYLGIDGEGQGREHHKYIFLACSNEDGLKRYSTEDPMGLSTVQALDFILSLPGRGTKIFAYAFGYDLTKILTDVDSGSLYKLFRPEGRQREEGEAAKGPAPVHWGGYALNLQGTKFTVSKGGERRVIWDIFKFYQSKFVNALKDWKVGDKALWERMQKMKDQRGDFDKLDFEEVKGYCFEECACMAELARKLDDAHRVAGIPLKSYYGAGSSAAGMLDVMGIKGKLVHSGVWPEEVNFAVSCAFFGGRFENSVIGSIQQPVFNKDIASAYPYQCTLLPCLNHGRWEHTTNRRDLNGPHITQGLVRYDMPDSARSSRHWGPFPYRTEEGSICFPRSGGGGWVYLPEYLAGERLFSQVRFQEAWVFKQSCDCKPFEQIPKYYLERLGIGKEGPGIVIKLGCNSCYGKLAQSVGNATYNSWAWAGMITSGCRAQLLALLGLHRDWSNVLMVATDGLASLEDVIAPKPLDTNTDMDVLDRSTGKVKRAPLGSWESKTYERGMFLARPGVYFPLQPTKDEIKDVRGRGVGKGVILESWQVLCNAWPPKKLSNRFLSSDEGLVRVTNVSRFCGAKSTISISGPVDSRKYTRAHGMGSAPAYGQWVQRSVDLSFDPRPKRARVDRDGVHLVLRDMPMGVQSAAYDRCVLAEESQELRAAELEVSEQPDGDLTEYL